MAKKSKLPIAKPPADICTSYKPTKEDEARQRRYRAEDALRTMNQAEDYKKDKKLMADVKALANEQMSNLKKFVK